MSKFMTLPACVIDELSANEMVMVTGGIGELNPPNNRGGVCSGTNNGTGKCNGTNNSTGICTESNNSRGTCTGSNNDLGVCGSTNNSNGTCNYPFEPGYSKWQIP